MVSHHEGLTVRVHHSTWPPHLKRINLCSTCALGSPHFFFFFFVSSDSFAGYITRGCSQPEEVDLTLKLLVSAAPVALIIIGLSILYSYPIDEERRQCNRKLLQEQRWGLKYPTIVFAYLFGRPDGTFPKACMDLSHLSVWWRAHGKWALGRWWRQTLCQAG